MFQFSDLGSAVVVVVRKILHNVERMRRIVGGRLSWNRPLRVMCSANHSRDTAVAPKDCTQEYITKLSNIEHLLFWFSALRLLSFASESICDDDSFRYRTKEGIVDRGIGLAFGNFL